MEFDFNEIIQTVLVAILPAVAAFAAAWLRQWVIVQQKKIEAEIGEQWSFAIKDAVQTAVKATEQSALAGLIDTEITSKKAFAIDSVKRQLTAIGIDIDVRVIADMIEAAVLEVFNPPDVPQIERIL